VRPWPILLLLALVALPVPAQMSMPPQPAPALDRLRAAGMNDFYNLDYDQAAATFRRMTEDEPASAAAWNHLSQAELYREMYRIGALESQLYGHGDAFLETKLLPVAPGALAAFAGDNQRAMDLAKAEVDHAPADAHAHYDLAVAWALRGTCDFSLKTSYLSALSDAKAARREATEAIRLDPTFRDPVLILGVHNYVAGSLPWTAKMFSILMGYSGDKDLGRRQIAEVAQIGEHSRTDADVMLVVIDRRDGLNAEAAPILERLTSEYPRNTLFAVEDAEALEAAGDHAAARAQLQRMVERAAAHAPGYERAPLDKIWYDLGSIDRLFSRWNQAAADFRQVASVPRPEPHYVQAAALALGEVELRAGDAQAARSDFERCVSLDPSSDAGRAAAEALRQKQ